MRTRGVCVCVCASAGGSITTTDSVPSPTPLNAERRQDADETAPAYLLPRHRLAGLREEDARCPAADVANTVRVTCRFPSQQKERRGVTKATGKQSKQSACEELYEVGEQAN
jgi:hypothetical protein